MHSAIIVKFIILFYCSLKYILVSTKSVYAVILSLLIYISLSMLYYIIKKPIIKKYILLISLVYLLICFKLVNSLYILFLPIGFFELLGEYSMNNWLGFLALFLPPLILDEAIISEYILVFLFCYLIYIISDKASNRISKLVINEDNLRTKVYELYDKLDKNSSYEKQIRYTTKLEERNKIAQGLHDKLGHTVSASIMQLEAAKLLMERDIKSSKTMIQNSIDALRTGMENIRAVLKSIKPSSEEIGINNIRLMLDDFSIKSRINSRLVHTGNIDYITYFQWNIMYDNLKESLTNVIKYSNASSLFVRIDVLNKFIKMEVKDNGIGSFEIKKGLGIIGMEERTENVGGKIIIDGTRGFSVITLLPIGGEPHDKANYS